MEKTIFEQMRGSYEQQGITLSPALPYYPKRKTDRLIRSAALAVFKRVLQGYILESSHKRQAQFLPC